MLIHQVCYFHVQTRPGAQKKRTILNRSDMLWDIKWPFKMFTYLTLLEVRDILRGQERGCVNYFLSHSLHKNLCTLHSFVSWSCARIFRRGCVVSGILERCWLWSLMSFCVTRDPNMWILSVRSADELSSEIKATMNCYWYVNHTFYDMHTLWCLINGGVQIVGG